MLCEFHHHRFGPERFQFGAACRSMLQVGDPPTAGLASDFGVGRYEATPDRSQVRMSLANVVQKRSPHQISPLRPEFGDKAG